MPNPTVERYPELLSLAVHEFRTPASIVGGYLRMLQRDADQPLTDRQRKMVDEAEKSCARLVDVAAHVHEAEDRDVRLTLRGAGAAAASGDSVRLRTAFDAIFRAILRE